MDEDQIKQLIAYMRDREAMFLRYENINQDKKHERFYWKGKRKEAAFVADKLQFILDEGKLFE